MKGFRLDGTWEGEDYHVEIPAPELYSVHIEYEYLGKYGDCVDLTTLDDTLYCYPKNCEFSVTKMALATEELYQFYERQRQQTLAECRAGRSGEKKTASSVKTT